MATGTRTDPFRNFRFVVEFDNITHAGFSEASGFDVSTEIIEYRAGDDPAFTMKQPGITKHGNITLKRGVTNSMALYDWFKQISEGTIKRQHMIISLLDDHGQAKARWNFVNTWPCKYDFSDLSSKSNEVVIETLEIVHEGMTRDVV